MWVSLKHGSFLSFLLTTYHQSQTPPQAQKSTPSGNIREASDIGEDASEKNDQGKLKPLHMEKVNINTDHSMVWSRIEEDSFEYNGDMMEPLFGYVATNQKKSRKKEQLRKLRTQTQL